MKTNGCLNCEWILSAGGWDFFRCKGPHESEGRLIADKEAIVRCSSGSTIGSIAIPDLARILLRTTQHWSKEFETIRDHYAEATRKALSGRKLRKDLLDQQIERLKGGE